MPGRLTLARWAYSRIYMDAVRLCCLALQEHYFAMPEPGKLAARINWRINKPNGDFIERSVVQVCCLWGLARLLCVPTVCAACLGVELVAHMTDMVPIL